jgi:hypothetical protein
VLLDDPRVWADPRNVVRVSARLYRLPEERVDRLAPRARRVLEITRKLRCSVWDLRSPPGLHHVAAYLVLLAPAGLGALLVGPPMIALRLLPRSSPDAAIRRGIRTHVGVMLALPWGAVLAAAGAAWLGPAGVLAPFAALAGLASLGALRPLQRRVRCIIRVRRHRARALRVMRPIERLADELRTGTVDHRPADG